MSNSQQTRQSQSDHLGRWDDLRLAYRLYRDPRVSSVLKWIVPVIAAVYVVSPIDLIPDFLLGVGQVDDLGVIGLALFVTLGLIRRLAPRSVVSEHLSAMGRNGSASTASTETPSGDIFDTTFHVSQNRNDRTRQRTA